MLDWCKLTNEVIASSGCAAVQACHMISPNQQIPLPKLDAICIGHLEHRLRSEQTKDYPNEEVLQELSLLACAN